MSFTHRRLWQLGWVPVLIFLFHSSSGRREKVFAAGKPVSTPPRFSGAFGRLPIAFEPNRGQADSQIQFMVQQWNAAPVAVTLGRRGELRASFADGGTSIQMEIAGGNPDPEIQTSGRLPGQYNHFESRDRSRWIHGVPSYGQIEYRNIYPGIDLTYSGREGLLEYDWLVAAGADPDAIRLEFPDDPGAEINSAGELVAGSRGQLRHRPPRAYQLKNGKREYLSTRFIRRGPHTFGFAVGPYDRTRELVIDPTLVYSITMGEAALFSCCVAPLFHVDQGAAMAVDPSGNVYIGGSAPFGTGAFPPIGPISSAGINFVLKLDPTGTQVLYGTFFSGGIAGLAIDASGNAYLTGSADSTLAVTPGAAQTTYGGGDAFGSDAFAAKLDASGKLVYSTYIGGSRGDAGTAVAVDASGNAYITGETASDDFPTVHAVQAQRKGDMCINPSGSMTYCSDAFVTMVNPDGTGFVYSTYLGGTDYDHASGIAVDPAGNAYIAGRTNSADFPVTAGVVQNQFGGGTRCLDQGDGFVAKFGVGGQSLRYATYVGGHGCDSVAGIAVDSSGAAYVAGNTQSFDFPVTPGAFQSVFGGYGRCGQNAGDAFVAKLNPQASAFTYATYLGGHSCDNASAIAVDAAGNAYVTGRTASVDFPVYRPIQPMFGGPADCTTFGLPVAIECSSAFVTVLDPGGKAPVQSTYFGSPAFEQGTAIGVDGAGNTYVMGLVFHSGFHMTFDSANFPLVGSQLQPPGPIFVAKIGPGGVPPSFTQNSITDPSGSLSGLIAGATAVISGSNLTTASSTVTAPSTPPTTLMGTSVSINGTQVPILSLNGGSNPQQISIQVPAALAAGLATVVVNNNGNMADVTGVPAGVQIRRSGDAQAGIAGHPLPMPLSVVIPGGSTSNVRWEAQDGGFVTIPSGSSGAVWTLGQALGPHIAVAQIIPPSGGWYTVQFTATASAGNVPVPAVTSVLNTAGFTKAPAVLSPGMIASVFGTNLGEAPSSGVAASFIQNFNQYQLPTILAGAQVTFDGLAAPLFMVSPGQINVQVPYELAGYPSAQVVVTVAGIASPPMTVSLAPASPGIFTVNAQDPNLAAVLNQDNSVNSASNPAPAGSVIQMFCTGLGVPLLRGLATGEPVPVPSNWGLFRTPDTPAVTIGGSPALVLFSGLAPGFVGLYQVNIEVPAGISPGEVPLALSMSGLSANPVTVFVR